MRIIYIADIRFPTERAHGIQIAKMCETLGTLGSDVELVVPSGKKDTDEDPFVFYGIKPVFKVTYIPTRKPANRPTAFFLANLSFLRKVKKHLQDVSGVHIYSRDLLSPLFFDDIFIEVHDIPKTFAWLYRRAFRRAKMIAAKTSSLERELISRFGVDKARVVVVPNGIDIDEFSVDISREAARGKLGLPLARKIALYAGSFQGWKGLDIFLGTAALMKDTDFIVVGGAGQELSDAQTRFPGKNVMFIGRKPHAEIPLYLRAADVLVLPNKSGEDRSEKYTSPLKLFEYMASLTPIVVSRLPAIEEIVGEDAVYFFKADDTHECKVAIEKVFRNPGEALTRAARAKNIVEGFSWKHCASVILDMMKS